MTTSQPLTTTVERTSKFTLSGSDKAQAEVTFARLARFALAEYESSVPRNFRGELTRSEWAALTDDDRRERIRAAVYAERLAVVIDRLARRGLPKAPRPSSFVTPPESETHAPTYTTPLDELPPVVELAPATGWLVACVGGCGTWLAARPGRSVVAFCTPHGGQRTYAKRRQIEPGVHGNKPKRARTRAVCHGGEIASA